MTDFYDEWWTQRQGIEQALTRGGEILITGLGLGLIAEAMLRPANSPVSRITIIEFSPDVIRLVAPYIQSRYPNKVEIIEADAFTWQPLTGKRFTVGWHDIWPNPTASSNDEEMERLETHYRNYCDWQGFWPKTYIEAVNGKA
ncbi:MAG: class I SAM-dependent methyltransferase [Acidobacteriota bacterium]|nr:class I SAM-dependent methyltransferase [Acidobacteriota bacterium]